MNILDFPFIYVKSVEVKSFPEYVISNRSMMSNKREFEAIAINNPINHPNWKVGDRIVLLDGDMVYICSSVDNKYRKYKNLLKEITGKIYEIPLFYAGETIPADVLKQDFISVRHITDDQFQIFILHGAAEYLHMTGQFAARSHK